MRGPCMCGDPYCPSCGAAQGTLERPQLCLLPRDDRVHTDPQCEDECGWAHHEFEDGGPEGLCSATALHRASNRVQKLTAELFDLEGDGEYELWRDWLLAMQLRLGDIESNAYDECVSTKEIERLAETLGKAQDIVEGWLKAMGGSQHR